MREHCATCAVAVIGRDRFMITRDRLCCARRAAVGEPGVLL